MAKVRSKGGSGERQAIMCVSGLPAFFTRLFLPFAPGPFCPTTSKCCLSLVLQVQLVHFLLIRHLVFSCHLFFLRHAPPPHRPSESSRRITSWPTRCRHQCQNDKLPRRRGSQARGLRFQHPLRQ